MGEKNMLGINEEDNKLIRAMSVSAMSGPALLILN